MLLNACFIGHDDGETANSVCDRPGQDTSVLYLKSSTKTIGQRRCCVSAKQKKMTEGSKGDRKETRPERALRSGRWRLDLPQEERTRFVEFRRGVIGRVYIFNLRRFPVVDIEIVSHDSRAGL